jgi:chemotaxis protein histidine kinase CheA/ActR/RegA family two-component response regulator
MDASAFTRQFVDEARERLKSLERAVVQLEERPDSPQVVADIFRDAHSLKGSAQMLGFIDISQIAHQLEDLFVAARRDARAIDTRTFDLVFRTLDVISARVEELAHGGAAKPSETASGPEAPAATTSRAKMRPDQSLRVSVEKLASLTSLAPEMVIQNLKASARHAELRRVDASLSRLRDRVREARLSPPIRSRAAELGEYADTLDGISRSLRGIVTSFGDDHARLTLITEELRQHVTELTMLPVATVFDAFPRAVRDLTRGFGKEVELTLVGRETELEKRVLEKIADPLVHLLRNAIDHGIESPGERVRANKRPGGRLLVAAEQRGNRIQITVQDDGRGLDAAALRTTAVRKGIATAVELESWATEQLFELIFEPGFSTRTETTDVSGRGVGMDVVRVCIEGLGGTVRVQSEPNLGTTVLLDLPLSLAVLRVVLIEVGDEVLGLPTAPVRRILRVSRDAMTAVEQVSLLEIEGESMPIGSLGALLGVVSPSEGEQAALVVEIRDTRFAMTADAVLEEQELVFKDLPGPLANQRLFAGAALLGSGDVVPILDLQGVFDAMAAAAGSATPAPPDAVAERSARILVVEDSVAAGEMHRGILIGAGYEAEIAHDGVEALEALRERDWDLVISDVDMPNMDGFELTVRVRADPQLRNIPIIIVTSRDASHQREAADAGADAYVTKREFDQDHVLGIVSRLIRRGRESASATILSEPPVEPATDA